MKFEELIDIIERTSLTLRKQALSSVNQSLVIRNWIVGFYLVEFEQNGEDYAHYGEMLLETIAKRLKKKRIKGFSLTNLKLYRQFYLTYPQIGQPVADQFESLDAPIKSMFLGRQKSQPAADQLESAMSPAGDVLLRHLTFRHFTELIKVKDPVKRAFYENETIKTHWSARQLKRQIESLLIERIGLSRNKEKLLKSVRNNNYITTVEETIKDPYVLDFTGFKDLPVYTENDLETALLDKIHDFLVELPDMKVLKEFLESYIDERYTLNPGN